MDKLFIFDSFVWYVGHLSDVELHEHHAVQLGFAIDHEMELQTATGREYGDVFLVDSDIPHAANLNGGRLLVFMFEPETNLARDLKRRFLGKENCKRLDGRPLITNVRRLIDTASFNEYREVLMSVFSFFNLKAKIATDMDGRIKKAIALIDDSPDKKIKIKDIAESVCLSGSRLQHLFKKGTGISIKRFLLWQRLVEAVRYLQRTSDLTVAAYQSGFADSAHLSRTFRRMFGVTLKYIFKNSSIQVNFCRI